MRSALLDGEVQLVHLRQDVEVDVSGVLLQRHLALLVALQRPRHHPSLLAIDEVSPACS